MNRLFRDPDPLPALLAYDRELSQPRNPLFSLMAEMFGRGGVMNPTGPVVEPTREGVMGASQFAADMLNPAPGVDRSIEAFQDGRYVDAFAEGAAAIPMIATATTGRAPTRAIDFDSFDISGPRNNYDFLGFRTVESGFDPLTPSRHWEDGMRSARELPGVSVTDINEKLARNMHGLAEKNRRAGYYFGDRTYLVGGNRASGGEDLGELIIEDPTIIAEVMRKYGVASLAALPPAVLSALGVSQEQADKFDTNRAAPGAL